MYGGLVLLTEIELAEGKSKRAAPLFGFAPARVQAETVSFQEPDERGMARIQSALEKKNGLKLAIEAGAQISLEQALAENLGVLSRVKDPH